MSAAGRPQNPGGSPLDFRKYDRNRDGFITRQEFLEPVTVMDQFRGLDVNRDGRISRDEFLGPERQFRAMDRDKVGFITWEEFRRVMNRVQK